MDHNSYFPSPLKLRGKHLKHLFTSLDTKKEFLIALNPELAVKEVLHFSLFVPFKDAIGSNSIWMV